MDSVTGDEPPRPSRRRTLFVAVCWMIAAAATGATIVLEASGGGSVPPAHTEEVVFRPCITSVAVVGLASPINDWGYRPTARQALNDAAAGQPLYLFTDANAQRIPPHGEWRQDTRHRRADEIQFDHLSRAGAVDWVALVGYASESGVDTPTQQGWKYEIGSPWPTSYKQVPC